MFMNQAIRRIKLETPFPGQPAEIVYKDIRDGDNPHEYRRIVAGMAYPHGTKPGFVVVLGEDRTPDDKGRYHVHGIMEVEKQTVSILWEWCSAFKHRYSVGSNLYGQVPENENDAIMGYHQQWARMNRKLPKERINERVYVIQAPQQAAGHNTKFYASIIKCGMDEVTLHPGGCTLVKQAVGSMQPEALEKRAEEWPVFAAFGYAVSALSFYEYRGVKQEEHILC